MRRTGTVAAAVVLVLVVAGAVVAGSRSTESGSRDEVATGTGAATIEPAAPPVSVGNGRAVQTVGPAGPKIVRTADLSVEVGKGNLAAAFDRASSIATTHGGYVTASTTSSGGEDRRARAGQLTLRVPSDRYEDAKRALSQLGKVESESSRGEDVSGQIVDYDARLRSLQAQEESLRGLLGKAVAVGEVIQVQTALFDVRQQVEQLQAQRNQLDQAASLATIQVSLYEPGAAFAPGDPEPVADKGLAASFREAVDGSIAVVGGMIVVVGWLLPVAVLGALMWGVGRLLRRRGAAKPAAVPTP